MPDPSHTEITPLATLVALVELERARPGEQFTTAQVAMHAGVTNYTAGQWTEPTRRALFALMLNGFVSEPTGRPHHWGLSRRAREWAMETDTLP